MNPKGNVFGIAKRKRSTVTATTRKVREIPELLIPDEGIEILRTATKLLPKAHCTKIAQRAIGSLKELHFQSALTKRHRAGQRKSRGKPLV
jgi:hypothetical protein